MTPAWPLRHSVLPVLYVGRDLTRDACEQLRRHRVGVIVAGTAARTRRLLQHFHVAAIVFAEPDLAGVNAVASTGIPVIVLAARDAACDMDFVTIVRRECDAEELAAVIHGVVTRDSKRDEAPVVAQNAA